MEILFLKMWQIWILFSHKNSFAEVKIRNFQGKSVGNLYWCVVQSVDQEKLGQAFTCRVMPQARVSTRRRDIETLGQAFTCWVTPQAKCSTRRPDITSLVPLLVMPWAQGNTRRQDITSLGSGALPENRTSQA